VAETAAVDLAAALAVAREVAAGMAEAKAEEERVAETAAVAEFVEKVEETAAWVAGLVSWKGGVDVPERDSLVLVAAKRVVSEVDRGEVATVAELEAVKEAVA
jgi:hypothetical protein